VGILDQPDFLNGALLIETALSSRELLGKLLEIETRQGRVRGVKNGPRTLDLDLIFFGNEVQNQTGLHLPHPRAHNREFVLKPASEIAPEWVHPVLKKTVRELLEELSLRGAQVTKQSLAEIATPLRGSQ
jgi:2-amino-4-hydroxy-6-hydroxymethyldihydropteridine diphosphokinase